MAPVALLNLALLGCYLSNFAPEAGWSAWMLMAIALNVIWFLATKYYSKKVETETFVAVSAISVVCGLIAFVMMALINSNIASIEHYDALTVLVCFLAMVAPMHRWHNHEISYDDPDAKSKKTKYKGMFRCNSYN